MVPPSGCSSGCTDELPSAKLNLPGAVVGNLDPQDAVSVRHPDVHVSGAGVAHRVREDLRDQIILSRLREREVDDKIQVS